MRTKIGECLVQAGLISEEHLATALAEHERTGELLGSVLVRLNLATEAQIATALAFQLGFPYLDLAEDPPDPAAVALLPRDVAAERACVAVRLDSNVLSVAMADPLQFSLVQDLEFQTGCRIKQVVATRSDILAAIDAGYAGTGTSVAAPPRAIDAAFFEDESAADADRDAPSIIDLMDVVVGHAIRSGASDIHIEAVENAVVVRHRLDGVLTRAMELPKSVQEGLMARLKILAGMDAAERRLPQEGRLRLTAADGGEVDLLASSLRTLFGEKIVLRVLERRKNVPPLHELGLSPSALSDLGVLLRRPHGLLLVVGPARSGTTTTASAALMSIHSERTNAVTIEDPVEYEIEGVNQTDVHDYLEPTGAVALRQVLGQDADVILLSEIRDLEAASIALEAARVSHLIVAVLKADSAADAMSRLAAMGLAPRTIASALSGLVVQRLVRRLCVNCRQPYTPSAETLRLLDVTDTDSEAASFFRAAGCDQCSHTGYRGRVGLFEVVGITPASRRLVEDGAFQEAGRDAAAPALAEDGFAKAKAGVTTVEELLRVVGRVREPRTLCPQCGAATAAGFKACPQCGHRLTGACPSCGRALQAAWNFCPYCAHATGPRPIGRSGRFRRGSVPGAPGRQ
jgi:type IV pilus assembly protein PilB